MYGSVILVVSSLATLGLYDAHSESSQPRRCGPSDNPERSRPTPPRRASTTDSPVSPVWRKMTLSEICVHISDSPRRPDLSDTCIHISDTRRVSTQDNPAKSGKSDEPASTHAAIRNQLRKSSMTPSSTTHTTPTCTNQVSAKPYRVSVARSRPAVSCDRLDVRADLMQFARPC